MRHRIGLWVVGISAGCAILLSGCPAVLVGAGAVGTVAYLEGDLKSVEPHSLDQVYNATHKTLKELGMMVVKDTKEKDRAEIAARDVEDKKTTITLSSQYEGITNIAIRIDLFGDEKRSRRIYSKIHDYLQ